MTLSTLTAADSIALEFYEENLNYVNGFGLANLDRDERRLFNQGKKVAARIVDAAVAMSKTRTPYTDEQVLFIAETYAACAGDRQTIVSAFMNRFPLSGHSARLRGPEGLPFPSAGRLPPRHGPVGD